MEFDAIEHSGHTSLQQLLPQPTKSELNSQKVSLQYPYKK